MPKRGKKESRPSKNSIVVQPGVQRTESLGVVLTYDTERGHIPIDRGLYIPIDWIEDRERCREAGIPDSVHYRPKWELALEMLKRAVQAGITFR